MVIQGLFCLNTPHITYLLLFSNGGSATGGSVSDIDSTGTGLESLGTIISVLSGYLFLYSSATSRVDADSLVDNGGDGGNGSSGDALGGALGTSSRSKVKLTGEAGNAYTGLGGNANGGEVTDTTGAPIKIISGMPPSSPAIPVLIYAFGFPRQRW